MDLDTLWSDIDLTKYEQNTRCLAVNTILAGKYLVGPVLGQGGFGITYMGYDLNMETKIAIKEYFPVELVSRDTTTMHGDRVLSLSGEKSVTYQQGLKKYVAEAQNVSQFSEIPGVVSVKDFFYENDTAYIVMEYIDGISLKDYLKENGGRLSEEETLRIMKPVLEALVKVHDAGIIHRDISPDNIMLTFEEETAGGQPSGGKEAAETSGRRSIKSVKLIDFGAARMTAKNDQKSLTIILKHGYAPEEQYRTHGEQGSWTDVYAVCAVLYRMLTGETPVPAMDRMFKDDLKSFEELTVKVSANTSAAILKGLAVKKDDRIQNVQELIGALYEGSKVKAAGPQNKKKAYFAVGIAAALLVAVGGLALSGMLKHLSNANGAGSMTGANAGNALNGENAGQEGAEQESGGQNSGDEVVVFDDGNQEEVGEQIVFYHPQRSVDSGGHILMCLPDGTVQAYGLNDSGQCEVGDWTDVVRVTASANFSLGVRKDGTVLYAGPEIYGYNVELWEDIVDVQYVDSLGILGLKKDGSVIISRGGIYESQKVVFEEELARWTDMKAITSSYAHTFGLKNDGTVLGVDTEGNHYDITGWEDAECIDIVENEYGRALIGICEDGSVLTYNLVSYVEFSSAGELIDSFLQGEKVSQIFDDAIVTKDGKVLLTEPSAEKQAEILSSWNDMLAVGQLQYQSDYYYGVKQDGTVVNSMVNMGNASLEEFKNLEWVLVAPYEYTNAIIGYTKDGKVLVYGIAPKLQELVATLTGDAYALTEKMKHESEYEPEEAWYKDAEIYEYICTEAGKIKTFDSDRDFLMSALLQEDGTAAFYNGYLDRSVFFSDVKQIADVYDCMLVKKDGTVEIVDDGIADNVDEERFSYVREWTDIEQVYDTAYGVLGFKSDGTLIDESGILEDLPVLKKLYAKVYVSIVLGITEDDKVHVIYHDSEAEERGMVQVEDWSNVADIAIGESHTVGLLHDGTVVAAGKNNMGQCDVEEWTDVVSIAAGAYCTLGINKDGDLLIAGTVN